jgi:hypothetical protein
MSRIFTPEYRTELINSLPNDLRAKIRQFEDMIAYADNERDNGVIRDAQLANFFSLIYLAMVRTSNMVTTIKPVELGEHVIGFLPDRPPK